MHTKGAALATCEVSEKWGPAKAFSSAALAGSPCKRQRDERSPFLLPKPLNDTVYPTTTITPSSNNSQLGFVPSIGIGFQSSHVMSSSSAPHYSSLPSPSSSNSSGPYFISRAPTSTPRSFPTRRPWEEVFALYSFTRPYSLGEASLRISRNLHHFRVNYAMIALFLLFLTLLWHPFSIIVFLFTLAAWFFLYFFRARPVELFGRVADDRVVAAALAAVTLVAVALTGVWLNVLVAVLVGAAVIVLHAAFRSTEDLYVDEAEGYDGGLLSVVGSPPKRTTSTGYNVI